MADRRAVGGRRRLEETSPQIVEGLEALVDPETGGDPESPLRLCVLVRQNRAGVSRLKKQEHARKNHSYFLVFQNRRVKVASVARLESRL